MTILITAEHASQHVPEIYRHIFAGAETVLESHRAWDPGTRELAHELADALDAPLLEGRVSRLLVDLNRSATHPRLFSEFSRNLPPAERSELMASYWQPHWTAFSLAIDQAHGGLIHLACHSFTPIMNGVRRNADIGLLYDPAREPERRWCNRLAVAIGDQLPGLKVRMNYPYRGTSNGLGQQHRRIIPANLLLTIELELNSALVARADWAGVRKGLVAAISPLLRPDSGALEAVFE